MCGIAGAAGPVPDLSSALKQEFHEFLSCLFAMSELRGRHASGFWVWRNDHYVFERRPIPAENLIERSVRWKSLRFNPGTLYMLHTRSATDGDPNDNINNHPHMGDHTVMVHNGCIWSHKSLAGTYNLDMKSDCDSEVLLRLLETKDSMIDGLNFMYKAAYASSGSASIACAFVDRRNPQEIFISRNMGNPCSLYHSKKFGVTFFVSQEKIFEQAIELMYGKGAKPEIIGAKEKNVETYKAYCLKLDGTVEEKVLKSPSTFGTSNTNFARYPGHSYQWDLEDDDDDTPHVEYLCNGSLGKDTYRMKLTGELVWSSKDTDNEEEQEDDEVFLDQAEEMPDYVLKQLVAFLDSNYPH